jgi:hypothetical protein
MPSALAGAEDILFPALYPDPPFDRLDTDIPIPYFGIKPVIIGRRCPPLKY